MAYQGDTRQSPETAVLLNFLWRYELQLIKLILGQINTKLDREIAFLTGFYTE